MGPAGHSSQPSAMRWRVGRRPAVRSRAFTALIGQEAYRATGVNDDAKFERHVRRHLRKVARMTKTNEGFEKTLRYQ